MRWQVLLEWPVPSVVANEKCLNFAVPKPVSLPKHMRFRIKGAMQKCKLFNSSSTVAQENGQNS